jgi:hypothetical protein
MTPNRRRGQNLFRPIFRVRHSGARSYANPESRRFTKQAPQLTGLFKRETLLSGLPVNNDTVKDRIRPTVDRHPLASVGALLGADLEDAGAACAAAGGRRGHCVGGQLMSVTAVRPQAPRSRANDSTRPARASWGHPAL